MRLIILSFITLLTLLPGAEAPFYADKYNLLVFLDDQLISRPVRTPADWSFRRAHILENMQKVMGTLPKPATIPLDVQILQTEDLPGFRRQKITFASELRSSDKGTDRVPAYLLLPKVIKAKSKVPAILCLHQTTRGGKAEPAGLVGDEHFRYAAELAQRGYVTLAPDYPNFGEYAFDPYASGYASATMKAVVNHRRAVDLLQSLPSVDPNRIGVIGHSLGGHNALFLAAFDSRLKAIVSSCGFTSFAKYKGGDLTGWTHKGYMPRIAEIYAKDPSKMPFDFTEVLASLAPRPVFINAPVGDANFEVSGVGDCAASALPVYETVFRAFNRLVVLHPEAGHSFPHEVRQSAYSFLERWLK